MAYIVINDVTREVFLRKDKNELGSSSYEKIMYEIPDEHVPIYEEHYEDARERSFGTITEYCERSKAISRELKKLWASTRRFFKLV